MKASAVANVVRLLIGDTNKQRKSDTEFLVAINETQRRFFDQAVMDGLPLFLETEVVHLRKGWGDLPSDFGGIYSVFDGEGYLDPADNHLPSDAMESQYRIEGGSIYANASRLVLRYYAIPRDAEVMEDELTVPETLSSAFKNAVSKMVMGNLKGLDYELRALKTNVTPRMIDHIPNDKIFA